MGHDLIDEGGGGFNRPKGTLLPELSKEKNIIKINDDDLGYMKASEGKWVNYIYENH